MSEIKKRRKNKENKTEAKSEKEKQNERVRKKIVEAKGMKKQNSREKTQ